MITTDLNKESFFMISSGNWQQVVLSSSKREAIKEAFGIVISNPKEYSLSNVVIVMDISESIGQLTLEDSLKFTSILDVADYIEDENMGNAIRLLFGNV